MQELGSKLVEDLNSKDIRNSAKEMLANYLRKKGQMLFTIAPEVRSF